MKLIVLLLSFYTIICAQITIDSTVDLWVIAGQSNALGVGTLNAARDTANTDSAYVYYRQLQTDTLGTWRTCYDPSSFCCASIVPRFAERMVNYVGRKIGVINAATANTSLVVGDSSNSWGFRNASDHYDTMFLYGRNVRFARTGLNGQTPKGIIWYQGESECSMVDTLYKYSVRFDTLREWFREDVGDVPVFIVQLASTKVPGAAVSQDSQWTRMRQYQYDSLPNGDDVVFGASAYDLPVGVESVHLTTAGLDSLGARLAYSVDRYNDSHRLNYPRITKAFVDADTVVLQFNAVLYPQSAISGLIVSRGADTGTISSVWSTSMGVNVLTDISPLDSISVSYMHGAILDYTNPVRTRWTLPVLPIGDAIQIPYNDRVGRLITGIIKAWGKRGYIFAVYGSGFGISQSGGSVFLDDTDLGAASFWSNTLITDTIPAAQPRGYYDLIVVPSAGMPDTVTQGMQVIVPAIGNVTVE